MSSVQEGCIHLAERAYKVTVVAISYRDLPCIYTLAAATAAASVVLANYCAILLCYCALLCFTVLYCALLCNTTVLLCSRGIY